MSILRSDVRTEVRDNIYEAAADIFSDTQLNRFISRELLSLPSKGIYLEGIRTLSTVINQDAYALLSTELKIELVERNIGTDDNPTWEVINGCDNYAGSVYLPYKPGTVQTLRFHAQKYFTLPTGDVVAMDIPDDKAEALVWGVVVRCYKALIGYFRNAKNWDAISKPDGISLSSIQSWLRDAKQEYQDILAVYVTNPRPRDIDLVS